MLNNIRHIPDVNFHCDVSSVVVSSALKTPRITVQPLSNRQLENKTLQKRLSELGRIPDKGTCVLHDRTANRPAKRSRGAFVPLVKESGQDGDVPDKPSAGTRSDKKAAECRRVPVVVIRAGIGSIPLQTRLTEPDMNLNSEPDKTQRIASTKQDRSAVS